MDKKFLRYWNLLCLLSGSFMPSFLLGQSASVPPEGIRESIWKQANHRWDVRQYPARIIALDRSETLGQIYAIEDDSLLLWPSGEIFLSGREEELVGLSLAEIDSIYIQRKRNFWQAAGKGALIGGFLGMASSLENADGDFLPPVVQVLLSGVLVAVPSGLGGGWVHKARTKGKAFPLTGDPLVDSATLERVTRYALYPQGRPAGGNILEEHPLGFSPELQELEQSLDHAPLLKRLFPNRAINLELYGGAGYRGTRRQMIAAMGQTAELPETSDPLVVGVEVMVKVKPHWRTGAALQYSREERVVDEQVLVEEDSWGYFRRNSLDPPVLIAGMLEYVHRPMHRLLFRRLEWSAGGGVSLIFTRKHLSVGYKKSNSYYSQNSVNRQERGQLPGLLLQSRLRYYPQKNLSVGIKGQLHAIFPLRVGKISYDNSSLGPPLVIEAHTLNLSSAVLLGTVGLHF